MAGGTRIVYVALSGGPEFTALQIGTMEASCIFIPIPEKITEFEAARYFEVIKPDVICLKSLQDGKAILEALIGTECIILQEPQEPRASGHAIFSWADVVNGRARMECAAPSRLGLPPWTRMIQFTSGSTGHPKAILFGNEQILASLQQSKDHLSRYASCSVFIPVPQFHAMGNAFVLEHLWVGSSVHMTNSILHAEHLKRLIQVKAVALQGSPNYFRMLLRMESFCSARIPALRFATLGSDWVDMKLITNLLQRFPELTVFCRYGLTEAFGPLSYNEVSASGIPFREGCIGRLLQGATVAPDERPPTRETPITLRIKSVSAATHQMAVGGKLLALADKDGYTNTGDMMYREADGAIILAGRESQFIKFNGYRISPFEIEETLRKAPGVAEAYVSGVPDPVSGQRIVACITSGPNPPDVGELRNFCLAHLSAYKIPHQFVFGFKIPKTHSGKVARRELAEQLMLLPPDSAQAPRIS